MRYACAPDIYAGEQKQPYDVDEVPVPGGEFEAEMLGRREVAFQSADQAADAGEDTRSEHYVSSTAGRCPRADGPAGAWEELARSPSGL